MDHITNTAIPRFTQLVTKNEKKGNKSTKKTQVVEMTRVGNKKKKEVKTDKNEMKRDKKMRGREAMRIKKTKRSCRVWSIQCNSVEHTHTQVCYKSNWLSLPPSEYPKLSSSPLSHHLLLFLLFLPCWLSASCRFLLFFLSTVNNYHIWNILPDVLAPASTNINHPLNLSSDRRRPGCHYVCIWNFNLSA